MLKIVILLFLVATICVLSLFCFVLWLMYTEVLMEDIRHANRDSDL